jgi:hypothetical protein
MKKMNMKKRDQLCTRQTQDTRSQKHQSILKMPKHTSDDEANYEIIAPTKWNIAEMVCGLARPNKSGQGKTAGLSWKGKRFYLRTPKMFCPFGASKPKPIAGKAPNSNDKWSIQMVFGDDEESQIFQEKAQEFDSYMISEGTKPEYCVSWLDAPKSKLFNRDVVESKYTVMVKHSMKDGEIQSQYPPFIRPTFPTTFNPPCEFRCELYDRSNRLLSASPNEQDDKCIAKVIPPGSQCIALMGGSIWCTAKGYGVTWSIQQLKVYPSKSSIPRGKCLVGDPEDEDEDEEENPDKKDDADAEEIVDVEAAQP